MFITIHCSSEEIMAPDLPPDLPEEKPTLYTLPIVVHIVHLGEPIGEGSNLSMTQIESQLRVLNEDFRRKEGTNGFNTHPDGGDAEIEFVLAKTDPNGNATTGVVRIDMSASKDSIKFAQFDYYASLSYWNPEQYINVWSEPYPKELIGLIFGFAKGPETDLPGGHLFQKGEPEYREGILMNYAHFGETNIEPIYNLGRTLTHAMGHYLGLINTWGTGDCATNDYVDDTPAVDSPFGPSCYGEPKMVANYMTWSTDAVMNIFTKGQISRMHYVLENSPYRTSLLDSQGLKPPNID